MIRNKLSVENILDLLVLFFIVARITFRGIIGFGFLCTFARYLLWGVSLVNLVSKKKIKKNDYLLWSFTFIIVAGVLSFFSDYRGNALSMVMTEINVLLDILLIALHCYEKQKVSLVFAGFFVAGIVISFFQFSQFSITSVMSMNVKYLTQLRIAMTQYENVNITAYNLFVGLISGAYLYKYEKKYPILLIIGIVLICTGLVLTGSRKTFLAAVVVLSILFIGGRHKALKIFGIVAAVLGLFYFVMNNEVMYKIIGWRLASGISDDSSENRMELALTALRTGFNNAFGVGLDNYRYYNPYKLYAHNNIAELFADLGLLGLIAFYWMHVKYLLILLKNKWRDKARFWILFVVIFLFVDLGQVSYSLFAYLTMISVLPIAIQRAKLDSLN